MKRVIFLAFTLFLVLAGCRKEESIEVRKTCEPVKKTVRGIFRLECAVSATNRPEFVSLDVAGLTAAELKARLSVFTNAASVHVWMPGEKSWVFVRHAPDDRIRLDRAMEALAADASCTLSLPEIFASYAGTLAEILPAFESNLEGPVVPEWFVTKAIPEIGWISWDGVDADIRRTIETRIGECQHVRRQVLEGMMLSRRAVDRKDEDAVTDRWARAMKRNPNDPLILERMDVLERNARGFLEVGKVLQAMKCYETIVLVNPQDAVAVHNFGVCLRRIGREDMAEKVLDRAEKLMK